MWRLAWMVPIWVAWLLLVEVPLFLIGIVVVPLAAACQAYDLIQSPIVWTREIRVWSWRWMWLWGNDEDGVDGLPYLIDFYSNGQRVLGPVEKRQRWWLERTATWSVFRRVLAWAAWRNGVSNLRFTRAAVRIDPKRVRVFSRTAIYTNDPVVWLAWQGWRARIHWESRKRIIEVGWKIHPSDTSTTPLPPDDVRRFGAGFGVRLKKRA